MEYMTRIPDGLETVEEYRERTRYIFDEPFPPGFTVSPGVGRKVAAVDGELKPYAGNTVVLTLPGAARGRIGTYQWAVYDRAGWCLSRALPEETFHITLHDLESGEPSRELEARVEAVEIAARELTEAAAASGKSVRLRSTRAFCLASSSIVLGFEAEDGESQRILMALYEMYERIRPLGYPLTLHATLGYLRPLPYTRGHLEAMRAAVESCRDMPPVRFELPLSAAEYQRFSDMRTYWRA